MDKKIELKLLSVAGAQNSARIYAFIMGEKDGSRYFPVLANEAEAQAVVAQMQNVKVTRPLIYDVFAEFINTVGQSLDEVVIFSAVNGILYARLIFQEGCMIEAKAADAIALAVHFSCPVYALDSIVESENIVPDIMRPYHRSTEKEIERFNKKLKRAIAAEDYETAAKIRDIIKELSEKSKEEDNNDTPA